MKLYLVLSSDDDYNMDAFVTARTPQEAVELWSKLDFVEECIGQDGLGSYREKIMVHEAPVMSDRPMAHRWGDPVMTIEPNRGGPRP